MRELFKIFAVLALAVSMAGCLGDADSAKTGGGSNGIGLDAVRNSESKPAKTRKSANDPNVGQQPPDALKLRIMPSPLKMAGKYNQWWRFSALSFKYSKSDKLTIGRDYLLSPECAIPVNLNTFTLSGNISLADCVFPETTEDGVPIAWTAVDQTTVQFRMIFKPGYSPSGGFLINVCVKDKVETLYLEDGYDVHFIDVLQRVCELRKSGDDLLFHCIIEGKNNTPLKITLKMTLFDYYIEDFLSTGERYESGLISLEPFETRRFDIAIKVDSGKDYSGKDKDGFWGLGSSTIEGELLSGSSICYINPLSQAGFQKNQRAGH